MGERRMAASARGFYVRFGKRLFDIVVSAFLLAALSLVILAVAILVRLRLGSPVLFRQQRPGLAAKPFLMTKFRTMTDARGKNGELLPDGERLPRFGKLLRSTSLDELPELWNVLLGDMSLVGPRPLLTQYLPLYSPFQARRHDVRPGITGLAQVRGRNALSWDEKFAADIEYVENVSFTLDAAILFRTVLAVLKPKGISAHGEATMPVFKGNEPGESK